MSTETGEVYERGVVPCISESVQTVVEQCARRVAVCALLNHGNGSYKSEMVMEGKKTSRISTI